VRYFISSEDFFFVKKICGEFMELGLIQVYTGEGKGKTTAAIGQVVRSLGSGMKVAFIQFLKADDTGEIPVLSQLGHLLTIRRFNSQKKFIWNMAADELELLKQDTLKGYEFVKIIIREGTCDILVLDEFNWVLEKGFVDVAEFLNLLKKRPAGMEVIVTGRNALVELIDASDLVTEMKKIKHPMDRGIGARLGIER
jgi:cob(I)alamin adenosyltransferase